MIFGDDRAIVVYDSGTLEKGKTRETMDRMPGNPDFVTEALQLIGLPACACDTQGVIRAANPDVHMLQKTVPLGTPVLVRN